MKLIIFDLDGTLVNTVVDLNAGINYALEKNGYPTQPVEHTAHAIGNGIAITIARSLPEDASEEVKTQVLKYFREYYKDHYLDNSTIYPGMTNVLTLLKENGHKLAVATNKLDQIAREMINTLYPNIFDYIQGDISEFPKKPDPFLLRTVIQHFGIDRSDVVYVGDSEVDVLTAKNANVRLILVDYGFHRSNDFLYDYSGIHIKSPNELLDVIK